MHPSVFLLGSGRNPPHCFPLHAPFFFNSSDIAWLIHSNTTGIAHLKENKCPPPRSPWWKGLLSGSHGLSSGAGAQGRGCSVATSWGSPPPVCLCAGLAPSLLPTRQENKMQFSPLESCFHRHTRFACSLLGDVIQDFGVLLLNHGSLPGGHTLHDTTSRAG